MQLRVKRDEIATQAFLVIDYETSQRELDPVGNRVSCDQKMQMPSGLSVLLKEGNKGRFCLVKLK